MNSLILFEQGFFYSIGSNLTIACFANNIPFILKKIEFVFLKQFNIRKDNIINTVQVFQSSIHIIK